MSAIQRAVLQADVNGRQTVLRFLRRDPPGDSREEVTLSLAPSARAP